MRKVIVSEFVSLDGVAENPAWTFQFGSEEQEKYKFEELFLVNERNLQNA